MEKIRTTTITILQGLGVRLLAFFSRWDERNVLSVISGWIKVGVLGILLTLVGRLVAKSVPYPGPVCYGAPLYWNVFLTDASVAPNPTKGADSVSVRIKARVGNRPGSNKPYIKEGYVNVHGDTLGTLMRPVDGNYSDSLEVLEAKLYVGNLEPETTWIELRVENSENGAETQWIPIIISAPDSTEETIDRPEK